MELTHLLQFHLNPESKINLNLVIETFFDLSLGSEWSSYKVGSIAPSLWLGMTVRSLQSFSP